MRGAWAGRGGERQSPGRLEPGMCHFSLRTSLCLFTFIVVYRTVAAVERRGEMIVRILELRQIGRNNVEAAKKFFQLQDSRHIVQLVEIVKRPGQTLGLYIREGDGGARADGVFISRIALESAVYNSGCLKVGDEILAVNLVDVRRMSLDDVVIIMSIPRRLLLCTRQRKGMRNGYW
ncbi:Rho GTPase-activating protein 100F [Eumeta japonica]|uniref:Rho GTPase-activating protein 100F n=1 Tax=Eumeta variegata TaxID=151549 RepID=A0A4C1Y6N0_EUMVA|nr:Rho GTPase-activating protein 100F [Eumeta japonica]